MLGDEVIVVSGVPRSGTSLMMQMLARAGVPLLCDDRRPADASNPRGYFELEAVKATRRDASWLEHAPGHAVKVIHALLADLPPDRRYRVLWMERDPAEIVASQNAMLARLGADPGGLAPERLAEIVAAQIAEARALLEARPWFSWLPVSYAGLLADPPGMARSVARFLGMEGAVEDLAGAVVVELRRERRGAA